MKNEGLPFDERRMKDFVERTFSQDVDDDELKWHFDDENRIVIPVQCDGWKLQIDESLPFEMFPGKEYFIPVDVYHRTIKGKGDLKVKVYKLDREKKGQPVFSRTYENGSWLSDGMLYHVENGIPIHENAYRYGSDAWCDLVQECIELFDSGRLELSDEEISFLEDNPGKIISAEGEKVILNTPFRNDNGNGFEYYVDVMSPEEVVKRVYFNG